MSVSGFRFRIQSIENCDVETGMYKYAHILHTHEFYGTWMCIV